MTPGDKQALKAQCQVALAVLPAIRGAVAVATATPLLVAPDPQGRGGLVVGGDSLLTGLRQTIEQQVQALEKLTKLLEQVIDKL